MHAHELVRRGLRQALEACTPCPVVHEAADRAALERLLGSVPRVAVAVLQAEGPHRAVASLFQWMAQHHARVAVMALGAPDRRLDRRLVDLGARALLLPGVDQAGLQAALANVCQGLWHGDRRMRDALVAARRPGPEAATPLLCTDRQLEVLRLVAHTDEPTFRRIGQILHISHRTVEAHVRALMRLFGVCSRADLGRKARRNGLA